MNIYWYDPGEAREFSYLFLIQDLKEGNIHFGIQNPNEIYVEGCETHLMPDSLNQNAAYHVLSNYEKQQIWREFFIDMKQAKQQVIDDWDGEVFPILKEALYRIFKAFDIRGVIFREQFQIVNPSAAHSLVLQGQNLVIAQSFIHPNKREVIAYACRIQDGIYLHIVAPQEHGIHEMPLDQLIWIDAWRNPSIIEQVFQATDGFEEKLKEEQQKLSDLIDFINNKWEKDGVEYWLTHRAIED